MTVAQAMPAGVDLTERDHAAAAALLAWVLEDGPAPEWSGDPHWAMIVGDDGVLWARRDIDDMSWQRPTFGVRRDHVPRITEETVWEARVWGPDIEHHVWGDGQLAGRTAVPKACDDDLLKPTEDVHVLLDGTPQTDASAPFARCVQPGGLTAVLPVVDGYTGRNTAITMRTHYARDEESGMVVAALHVFTDLVAVPERKGTTPV
ncbi:hypothetical protein EF847_16030 [Actinobacteria bacterium YIM 96077]|uniref:Uncharacterized protein n=1 Tax=Phytoactinopolyspora halophila TaxID=1981511 RepID=A0A329QEA4_9ACTN|nr:hypothetical protein [Phytoactinopolyspora halophila]AYY13984.1 hypothetical protein EF847_16030 [Actinobacteria bacterium YIM 96077]RAW10039.1 hypothetical protein DPM12_19785 [Phytoactinopolyspora halophila]